MDVTLPAWMSIFLLFLPCLLPAQPQKPKLLPAAVPAARIREIQDDLAMYPKVDDLEKDKARREREFDRIRDIVASFVIAQLEAEPQIEREQLRGQLIRVFGGKYDEHGLYLHEPPYVFPVQQNPLVLAIVYSGFAWVGSGGARTAVESYVMESGKARLAGRGGSEMNGYGLAADQIWNPSPNSTSIMVHGVYAWSSGHELPAQAVLYGVSPAGVTALWKLAAPGLRLIGSDGWQFVIEYHDEERHGVNLPPTAFDVYAIDAKHQAPYRVLHQYAVYP
jgi:hypothetical protein